MKDFFYPSFHTKVSYEVWTPERNKSPIESNGFFFFFFALFECECVLEIKTCLRFLGFIGIFFYFIFSFLNASYEAP